MDGANLIFIYDGEFVQEDPLIKQAWENYRAQPGDSVEGICLVTGRRTEIARIHTSIKGVQGAQSSGAALVSFNAPAFESYGKEQSYNAPVGVYAAYAYTAALNYLLADREHRKSGSMKKRDALPMFCVPWRVPLSIMSVSYTHLLGKFYFNL